MNEAVGIGGDFGFGDGGGYRSSAIEGDNPLIDCMRVANGRAGLSALATYAKRKSTSRRNVVLMPAYLCHTIIQPFLGGSFSFRFYDVERDLSINAESVMDKYDTDVVAVILLSYFGHQTVEEATYAAIRDAGDSLIVDDRTHSLLSDMGGAPAPSGAGVCSVYSVRKWGPFPDLALLSLPDDVDVLPDRCIDFQFFATRLLMLILRGAFFRVPLQSLRSCSLWAYHKAERVLDARIRPCGSSILAQRLWESWIGGRPWREGGKTFCICGRTGLHR
jgi:hypothetical protein